jgi:nitrous oxidase accessory protein NosD
VSRRVARPAATALAILTVALCACGADATDAQSARGCDRLASPGNRAVQRLVDSLRPGQVGCLRQGTYRGSVTIQTSGKPGRPITLQPRPGARARLVGALTVTRRSAHVVVRRLHLEGSRRPGVPSPIVNGRRILFLENDVTNAHTAICFALGNPRFGVARDVTIQRNRIHECGQLPATNLEHGVYVAVARGTRIVGNWIYENADLGIQLYPNARDTYVAGNVIDGNGEGIIFGGLPRVAARDNLVQGNVISNSRLRNNVEWHFEGTVGTGNVVRRNCIGGGARDDGSGGIMLPAIGFTPVANLVAQPEFRAPGDYRLKPGSACTRVLAGDPNRVAGPPR